jgi:hypothetical protein
VRPTAFVAAAIALAGCGGGSLELNRRDGLLDSEPLPDLEATVPANPPLARDDAPSLSPDSLDRSAWEPTVVTVAAGQVESQPTYTTPWRTDRSTARARGEMPDASNVLEGPGDPGSLAREGLIQPFQPAASLVTAPVMIVLTPPWSTVRGPAGFVLVRPAGRPGNP